MEKIECLKKILVEELSSYSELKTITLNNVNKNNNKIEMECLNNGKRFVIKFDDNYFEDNFSTKIEKKNFAKLLINTEIKPKLLNKDERKIFKILKISAFTAGNTGGNPAGVWLGYEFPSDLEMQQIAAKIGFSETVFACPYEAGWRVRYFSPESEVPFCGHATIALGAALVLQYGNGIFPLTLNNTQITVEANRDDEIITASLQSPPTRSNKASPQLVTSALDLFGYSQDDLDPRISPALANAGVNHLLIFLKTRKALAAMKYDLNAGRDFMNKENLVTILFAYIESPQLFHTRNAFAAGGVYEDPATGAATAALAGYLRDIDWPHGRVINIVQGEDMGKRSLLRAEIRKLRGSSIRISGTAGIMQDQE